MGDQKRAQIEAALSLIRGEGTDSDERGWRRDLGTVSDASSEESRTTAKGEKEEANNDGNSKLKEKTLPHREALPAYREVTSNLVAVRIDDSPLAENGPARAHSTDQTGGSRSDRTNSPERSPDSI